MIFQNQTQAMMIEETHTIMTICLKNVSPRIMEKFESDREKFFSESMIKRKHTVLTMTDKTFIAEDEDGDIIMINYRKEGNNNISMRVIEF